MSEPSELAVLEARWERQGNYGMRQLFELISAVASESCNPHESRHDMFSDATSFRHTLKEIAGCRRFRAVHVASHGEKSKLKCGVGMEDVIRALREGNSNGNIRGIYFSACEFGQPGTLRELITPKRRTKLEWAAGYKKDLPWLESAAADLLFWSGYIYSDAKFFWERASDGAKNLLNYMPKIEHQFGFSAFKISRDGRHVEQLLQGG